MRTYASTPQSICVTDKSRLHSFTHFKAGGPKIKKSCNFDHALFADNTSSTY